MFPIISSSYIALVALYTHYHSQPEQSLRENLLDFRRNFFHPLITGAQFLLLCGHHLSRRYLDLDDDFDCPRITPIYIQELEHNRLIPSNILEELEQHNQFTDAISQEEITDEQTRLICVPLDLKDATIYQVYSEKTWNDYIDWLNKHPKTPFTDMISRQRLDSDITVVSITLADLKKTTDKTIGSTMKL